MANEYGSGGEPDLEGRRDPISEDERGVDESSTGGAVPPQPRPAAGDEGGPRPDHAAPELAGPSRPPPREDGDDTAEVPSPARPRRSGAAAGAGGAATVDSGFGGPALGGEISFGTWLRRQRELREIDLREIADKTKISLRYLKAMEQDRFEVLPAAIFARGFLREYSKYVGLNADEVVNYYLSTQPGHGLQEETSEVVVDPGSSRGPVTRGALLVLLLIVAGSLLAYFLFYRQSQEDARRAAPPAIAPPVSQTSVPSEVPPPPAEPVLSAPLVVTLDLTQECWIEARIDGAPQVSRLFVAGESIQLEADETIELTLGNAGGVEVQVNNMPFDLQARSGQVANVTIDLGTVQRLRQRGG